MFWAWYAISHMHYRFVFLSFFTIPCGAFYWYIYFIERRKQDTERKFSNFAEGQLLGSYRGWFCSRAVWITPLAILSLPFFTVFLVSNHDERWLAHSFREGVCYQKPGWLTRAPDINVTNSSFSNGNHPFWNTQRIKIDLKKPMR